MDPGSCPAGWSAGPLVVGCFLASFLGAALGARVTLPAGVLRESTPEPIHAPANDSAPTPATATETGAGSSAADGTPEGQPAPPPPALVCCITAELMRDPVFAPDGHSYERKAIETWFRNHATSPKTGERLSSLALVPNHNLRAQILEFRAAHGLPELPPWQPPPLPPPAASQGRRDPGLPSAPTAAVHIPQHEALSLMQQISVVLSTSPPLVQHLHEMGLPTDQPGLAPRHILTNVNWLRVVANHASVTEPLRHIAPSLHALARRLVQASQQAAAVAQQQQRQRQPQQHAHSQPSPPQGQPLPGPTPPNPSTETTASGSSGVMVDVGDMTAPEASASTPGPMGTPPGPEPSLFRAVRANNMAGVERELALLQQEHANLPGGRPFNPVGRRNAVGDSALHVAAWMGHVDLVRMLCAKAHEADAASVAVGGEQSSVSSVNVPSLRDASTPLHYACWQGHFSVVEALTASGASIAPASVNGETPLHRAVFQNRPAIVKHLCEVAQQRRGGGQGLASVLEAVREDGTSPLHLACWRGAVDSVALLLEHGADPGKTEFKKCATAVHQAAAGGHVEVLRLVLDTVRARERARGGDDAAADAAVRGLVRMAGKRGLQAVHFAASKGHTDAVVLLHEQGADLNSQTDDGLSVLFVACAHHQLAVARELLSRAVSLDGFDKVLAEGSTLLHKLIMNKQNALVVALLHAGAGTTSRTKNRSTCLHLASWSGLLDVATLLLDDTTAARCSGNAHLLDAGDSPAAKSATQRYIKELLEARTEDGDTALHQAAFNNHLDIVLLLAERGARLDATKLDGNSAAHLAVQRGLPSMVKLLLSRGADPHARNARGMGLLDTARQCNQPNVAVVIQEHLNAQKAEARSRSPTPPVPPTS